jgi:hypothetical protein
MVILVRDTTRVRRAEGLDSTARSGRRGVETSADFLRLADRLAMFFPTAMLLVLAFLSQPPAASAEPCPNEQLRIENNSTQLPDCRSYELVTPTEKLGNPVPVAIGENGAAVSSDGQRVLYFSLGVFGDQTGGLNGVFQATRNPIGWRSTSAALPVTAEHPNNDYALSTQPVAASADFSTLFYDGTTQTEAGTATASAVFARAPDGSFASVSQNELGGAEYEGSSADGGHVVFEMTPSETAGQLHGQVGGVMSLYDRTGGTILPVGVDTSGSPTSSCGSILAGTEIGVLPINYTSGLATPALYREAVSADGSKIFFVSPDVNGHLFSRNPSCNEPSELYVREADKTTTEISLSQKSGAVGTPAPDGAHFEGASADGSRTFFYSPDQLTDDPASAAGGLYEYDLNTHLLTFIATADVLGSHQSSEGFAPQISADGSHVYLLGSVAGVGPSGENLYLWNDGRLSFIAPHNFVFHTSEVSADGSALAFATTTNLTGYDSRGQDEIYVYRAGVGALVCVSCNPDGVPPAGPAELYGSSEGSSKIPSGDVTEDGGRIFFDSPDRLLPQATNGLYNVYEYESGTLHLLSNGNGPYESRLIGASSDGTDVIIATADTLVPQDRNNGSQNLYDVRIDGGFPAPATPTGCEGESCQGQQGVPPVFPSSASASYPAGENLVAPMAETAVKPLIGAQKLARALRACRAKHRRRKRAVCEAAVRKRYGLAPRGKRTNRKAG